MYAADAAQQPSRHHLNVTYQLCALKLPILSCHSDAECLIYSCDSHIDLVSSAKHPPNARNSFRRNDTGTDDAVLEMEGA